MHSPFNILAVATILAGSVLSHGDEQAKSVALTDFKASFTSSAIVPDILAAFNPSVGFYVGYASSDGDATLLEPGMSLSVTEAKAPFELSVEMTQNATNITSATRFIVYMIGPDVPSRSTPTSRNVRHFLAGNLTLSTKNSTLLSTATTLQNLSSATNEYLAPAPSPNTGSHRYIYLLYTQPSTLNTRSFASLGFNITARTGFNLTAFRSLAGLGPSIGGTFFTIETDNSTTTSNDTSTVTSNSTATSGSSVMAKDSLLVNVAALSALLGAVFFTLA